MNPLELTEKCRKLIEAWDGYPKNPNPENRLRNGIVIFKNTFVDRYLASAHPMTPLFLWGPIIGYGLYVGLIKENLNLLTVLGLFLAGIVMWTLAEYCFHRFIFHHVPNPKRWAEKVNFFLLHGYHHEFPNHGTRLVAPPLMGWLIGGIVSIILYLVLGYPFFLPFLAGFLLGYMAYDWIHFYTHHFRPKGGVGKFLREYHLVHHYKFHEMNFGISNPFWDLVFGTYHWEKEPSSKELRPS